MDAELTSPDIERALLGAALFEPSVHADAAGLRPDHFADALHGRIWQAICDNAAERHPADFTALAPRIGGDVLPYLADLFDKAPPAAGAPGWAAMIAELALRRAARAVLTEASATLARPDEASAFEALGLLRSRLDTLEADAGSQDTDMVRGPDLAQLVFEQLADAQAHGRQRGRMTGLACIDRRLGGLLPGKLIVVGGRPGMGKTALARAIAHGCAARNPKYDVLFCGIEMGPEEMMQRQLSALTWEHGRDGVEYNLMARGKIERWHVETIAGAKARVPANLVFADCPRLGVDDVRRRIWTLAHHRPVAACVIDYLQLMQRPPAKGSNDASVLGQMTAALKQIARQLGVAIILLSQLSRGVESRDDKRPQLSDLRESGAIEQDADVVLFPYREHYYLERAEPPPGPKHGDWETACEVMRHRLDVICAKQRQGPVGTDRQEYWPEFDAIFDGAEA